MTSEELVRDKILAKLTEILGEQEAATIMESIPPFNWSELAMKADLKEYAVLEQSTMPSYRGRLSDSEIGDVAGYLLSLKGLK